ncbi:MAG TPA: site-specific integrase [Polyangiaceae bacterium]|jgi:integrase|nr:site-specific integrase [Polyangiaceae bacterium]
MSKASTVVTRGGVKYEVPEPTLRADEVVHSLRIGAACYFFTARAVANSITREPANGTKPRPIARVWPSAVHANDAPRSTPRRASAISSEEHARMWATLDSSDRDDLRVAALFLLLREGLRKNEIVRLNLGDLSDHGEQIRVVVRGGGESGRTSRLVEFDDPDRVELLRRYAASEHGEPRDLAAPLFWTLGRHGACRRVRITSHALSYWVTQLQRRAGITRRLSPHAFRRAWLAEGIERGEVAR